MAKIAKELAFELFSQGKRPSDLEIKALGLKSKTTYTYYQQWKKEHPQEEEITTVEPSGTTIKPSSTTTVKPGGAAPIAVGKITITPENWGMTQYGAILILDTYNKAKRDLNYGGTIGDFLCDICEFYRRILNYTEVEYGREGSDGGGSAEKDGTESSQPPVQLVEG